MISYTILKACVIALFALEATEATPIQERGATIWKGTNAVVQFVPVASPDSSNEVLCSSTEQDDYKFTNAWSPLVSDCEKLYQYFRDTKGHQSVTNFTIDTRAGKGEAYLGHEGSCGFAIYPSTPQDTTISIGNVDIASLIRVTIDRRTSTFDGAALVQGSGLMFCGGIKINWVIKSYTEFIVNNPGE